MRVCGAMAFTRLLMWCVPLCGIFFASVFFSLARAETLEELSRRAVLIRVEVEFKGDLYGNREIVEETVFRQTGTGFIVDGQGYVMTAGHNVSINRVLNDALRVMYGRNTTRIRRGLRPYRLTSLEHIRVTVSALVVGGGFYKAVYQPVTELVPIHNRSEVKENNEGNALIIIRGYAYRLVDPMASTLYIIAISEETDLALLLLQINLTEEEYNPPWLDMETYRQFSDDEKRRFQNVQILGVHLALRGENPLHTDIRTGFLNYPQRVLHRNVDFKSIIVSVFIKLGFSGSVGVLHDANTGEWHIIGFVWGCKKYESSQCTHAFTLLVPALDARKFYERHVNNATL
jgi:hypothetical protein